jgi:hypothetical protein
VVDEDAVSTEEFVLPPLQQCGGVGVVRVESGPRMYLASSGISPLNSGPVNNS